MAFNALSKGEKGLGYFLMERRMESGTVHPSSLAPPSVSVALKGALGSILDAFKPSKNPADGSDVNNLSKNCWLCKCNFKISPPASSLMSVLLRPLGAVAALAVSSVASPVKLHLFPFVSVRGALRTELGLLPLSLLLPLAPGPLWLARCMGCCCSVCLCLTYPTGGGTES